MKAYYFFAMTIFLFAQFAFGHGSDKPGPNGGYVEMPGAFHTELVPEKNGAYRIYLIDVEFKNPIVINSEVKMWFGSGKKKIDFGCKAESDSFLCSTENKISKGELTVLAKRDGMQGNEAKYRLPLKPWKK